VLHVKTIAMEKHNVWQKYLPLLHPIYQMHRDAFARMKHKLKQS